jgi:ATP synthase protein I
MPQEPRKDLSVASSLGQVLGLSAQMVVTTIVGGVLGYFADKALGTSPLFLIVGVLLGGTAAIVASWRAWKRYSG